jgi:hypothetical protein
LKDRRDAMRKFYHSSVSKPPWRGCIRPDG